MKEGGVIAYFLPAHTSGKMKSLDVGLYGLFKNYLKKEVHDAQHSSSNDEFDEFDLLKMISRACDKEFTKKS